ncbi:hypothetical protein ABK040_015980 [Willaertia magna]
MPKEKRDGKTKEENCQQQQISPNTSSYPVYGLIEKKSKFHFPYLHHSKHDKISPIMILQNKEIRSISCSENSIYFLTKENEIYICKKSLEITENNQFPFHVIFNDELTTKFEKSVIQIECGQTQVLFLIKEGFVFGFGSNHDNVLGMNFFTVPNIEDYPRQIPNLKDIIQIKAGVNHSLFLNRNYEIFACGSNTHYQIAPHDITNKKDVYICKVIINNLKKNEKVVNMICGGYHNFFITNLNNVFCNGNNGQGQLGGVSSSRVKNISYFLEDEKFNIKKIACGCNHTIFLTNDHKVYGLGFNSFFQISSLSEINVTKPTEFNFNFKKENEYIIDVACGMNHSLFISNFGNVYGVGNSNSFRVPKMTDNPFRNPSHLGLPLLGHNEYWKVFSGLYFNGTFFVKSKSGKDLVLFFNRLKERIVMNSVFLSDIDIAW